MLAKGRVGVEAVLHPFTPSTEGGLDLGSSCQLSCVIKVSDHRVILEHSEVFLHLIEGVLGLQKHL